MACNSLSTLSRACNTGLIAGLQNVYIIAYKDIAIISGTTNNLVDENNIITEIGLATGATFSEIGLLKDTAGLDSKATINTSKGIAYFTETFTVALADLNSDNQIMIQNVLTQPVAVIVRSRTGNYYISGLNGLLYCKDVSGGTGVKADDTIGSTLSFEGLNTIFLQQVTSSYIPSIVTAAA